MDPSLLGRDAYGVLTPKRHILNTTAAYILDTMKPCEIRPLPYRALAERAWSVLGWRPPSKLHAQQSAENLREDASYHRKGFGYLPRVLVGDGHPDVGAIFLLKWVRLQQRVLFNTEAAVELPLEFGASTESASEAILRFPHVLNRYSDADEPRAHRLARGLLIQGHVSEWFRRNWPLLYRPPSNHRDYVRPSSDDFRMLFEGRMHEIDVKGPNADGSYRCVQRSPKASIYLLADGRGNSCRLFGWCTRNEFVDGIDADQSRPLSQLFVRFNCAVNSIDYEAMKRCAGP